MTKFECNLPAGSASTAAEERARMEMNASGIGPNNALHNCGEFTEVPVGQALLCDSAEAAEASQHRHEGEVMATAWPNVLDPADVPARQQADIDVKRARRRAKRIWKAATRAPQNHWFMKLGGIQPHGLRVGPWKFKDGKEVRDSVGELLIPIHDHRGVLQSLRCVPGTCMGDQMLPGSALRGNYFSFGDGLKRNPAGQAVMYFLTDFCAAATIFEVTGYRTLCCFEDQNLLFVAQAISKGRQLAGAEALEMVFIDGHDVECDGTSKARESAYAVDGYFVPPPFGQLPHDLPRVRIEQGPEAVWEILASRVKASAACVGGTA